MECSQIAIAREGICLVVTVVAKVKLWSYQKRGDMMPKLGKSKKMLIKRENHSIYVACIIYISIIRTF